MMRYAIMDDYERVKNLFDMNRKVFPHVRNSHLRNRITRKQMIFEDDVAITFHIYKRKGTVGDVTIRKGDVMLHQIVAGNQGDGSAASVLKDFFVKMESPVYLTVRADNARAVNFYHKMGMKQVGTIAWSSGKIDGLIFRYELTDRKGDNHVKQLSSSTRKD